MSLFAELKRRNVFRVGIAYVLMGWVLLQGADFVLDLIGAPNWVIQVFVLAVVLGLPVALFFAWAFELTPEGIKREHEVDRSQSITPKTGRRLDYAIIGILVVIIVLMGLERLYFAGDEPATPAPQEQAAAAPDKTIAVLPFADLSQSQDQGWFADGLAEEILNALAKTPDLMVSSRTSTLKYRSSDLDIQTIASQLGVAHVLEGSVRSGGGRIRVTAQLIRASDGFHVWSENYDRDEADMISIQEDLARNIAHALETTMDPEALAAMSNAGTRSVEAYKHYLQGLNLFIEAFSSASGPQLVERAYNHFERARDIDPGFANAHWQAAEFWKIQLTPSRTDSGVTDLAPVEMVALFNERIDQAIESAPTEIDRVRFLANKAEVELRLRDAIGLYRDYLEQRPNDEMTRFGLINVAAIASNDEIRLRALERWRELGANDEWMVNAYINEAYRVIDASEAADFGLQALQRWPTANGLLYQTHRTLMWAGRIAEARQLHDRFYRLDPGGSLLVAMRQACAEGRRKDAEEILARLDPEENDYQSELWHMYKLLGREQDAINVLRPIAASGVPYQLASHLSYHKFDPSPFPAVMAVLDREGVNRPAAVDIPFKCPPPDQPSIAVLPFVNMSADPENEYFSDGVAEEILNVLASVPELKVTARTSAFAFKGSKAGVAEIAQALGVNHVLEGSVRKAGNQVRVTAQLIKADDGFHLWSETYDRELTNIFEIQDEIAGAIAGALKVTLELGTEAPNFTGTTNPEAYDAYLRGINNWHLRTAETLRSAETEFRRAVELDPDFAGAHAGLALTYAVMAAYLNEPRNTYMDRTRKAAEAALALDPARADATAALIQTTDDVAKRLEYGRRAIELNPSFASARQWHGTSLGMAGDLESAIASFRKSFELDPRSRIIGFNYADWVRAGGQHAQSRQIVDQVLSFAPHFRLALEEKLILALQASDAARAEDAARRIAAIRELPPDSVDVYLDLLGTPEERRAAAEWIAQRPAGEWLSGDGGRHLVTDFAAITIMASFGRHREALSRLREIYDARQDISIVAFTRLDRTLPELNCLEEAQAFYASTGLPPLKEPYPCKELLN